MKLKLSVNKVSSPDNATPQTAAPPTPSSASGSSRSKITIKSSQPATPATQQPISAPAPTNAPKGGRKGRNGAGGGAKKRAANDDTISPNPKRSANGAAPKRSFSLKLTTAPHAASQDDAPQSASGLNTLKLTRKSTLPKLKGIYTKRLIPQRTPGVGYDSEDSEAEADPSIQQGFILRMQPGDDCDYVRQAVANGKIGLPPNEGGAEVSLRFLDKDSRRAIVTVQKRMYAAVLVDLPCIVETMKSWDRKGWWKVADVNQMLLVLGRCTSDDEAKTFPLPKEVDKKNLQYAHGLTPPMHWVRKRRFRKRLSYKTIANVEEEVERLLKEDDQAEKQGGEATFEYYDRADLERSQEPDQSQYDEDMDAEGEAIETVENGQQYEEYYSEEGDDDLEGNLQAMFDEDHATSAVPATDLITDSPAALPDPVASFAAVEHAMAADESAAETPAQDTQENDESSDEDEEESDYDEEDSPDVMDEDAATKAAERNQQLEEVADLEREVEAQKMKVEAMKNQLLKERAIAQLRTLEEDLRVKRQVFGLDGED